MQIVKNKLMQGKWSKSILVIKLFFAIVFHFIKLISDQWLFLAIVFDMLLGSVDAVPIQCCSLPFTLNGQLYYGCTNKTDGDPTVGCFLSGTNRTWVTCGEPIGETAHMLYVNINLSFVLLYKTFGCYTKHL